jgi:hypothetical protein
MSYLIELCGDLPAIPLDEGECFYGIGLVMTDIHSEIIEFARALERWEIYRAQKKNQIIYKSKPDPVPPTGNL